MRMSEGSPLGIYRLISRLGAGGMGEVWKAEDTVLHRTVAIKLLPPHLMHDEESRARLLREARTAGQLNHPNIATIHGVELEGEAPYIVMEYVEGESLSSAIQRGCLSEAQISEIGRSVCEALAVAHQKGIVHRDIKPDNIILATDRVKVLDFGIAKQTSFEGRPLTGDVLTEAGIVLGTVHYMSPEQALGRAVDGRSDLFSLGVVLYEALAGTRPFQGDTVTETLMLIIRDDHRDLRSIIPDVSAELNSIINRCLSKRPDERFTDASEVARELNRAVNAAATSPHVRRVVSDKVSTAVHTDQQTSLFDTGASTARNDAVSPPSQAAIRWLIAASLSVIAIVAVVLVIQSRRRVEPTLSAAASSAPVSQQAPPPSNVDPPRATDTAKGDVPAITQEAALIASATQAMPSSAKEAFRAGMDLLESGQWHYIDASGTLTAEARSAKPYFDRAIELDPKSSASRLRLGEWLLFSHRFDEATSTLTPLSNDPSLTIDERAIAMFALSATAVARIGTGWPDFEKALQAALPYYSGNREFVAFAADVRILRRLQGK